MKKSLFVQFEHSRQDFGIFLPYLFGRDNLHEFAVRKDDPAERFVGRLVTGDTYVEELFDGFPVLVEGPQLNEFAFERTVMHHRRLTSAKVIRPAR